MSSRLPTSALSRSVSSSIVSRNSCRASGVQSTSCWSRLVTDALIGGDRRAQVVGDGGEQRGAQLVRGGERARRLGLRLRARRARRDAASSLAKASRTRWSSLRIGPPASARTCSSSSSIVGGARLGALGNAVAARRLDPPAALGRWRTAAPSRPSDAAQAVEQGRAPVRSRRAAASASASARARAPSAARRAASATKRSRRRRRRGRRRARACSRPR